MKTKFLASLRLLICALAISVIAPVFGRTNQPIIKDLGDGNHMLSTQVTNNYLLLPIQESAPESTMQLLINNHQVERHTIRLAIDKIDYFVPVNLKEYQDKHLVVRFLHAPTTSLSWDNITLSDTFDKTNKEKTWRPIYHFTPNHGWMNDPNGMFYNKGVYHLYYQYNPYASVWGNMHWGHATSTDLCHWKQLPIAIFPDDMGTIFSGSCVVDHNNTSGLGAGTIFAFYTSTGVRQKQCMAYSTDEGMTFTKYEKNPIVTSTATDFRDPKVVWYAPEKKWIMLVATGQYISFYTSKNLKDWTYSSQFGFGEGNHAGVWECPDLIELPIQGSKKTKWVLLVNINPGGPFGGSATQYFVGQFDGSSFINDAPRETKWLDHGKDHYATVTWNNAPNHRVIALSWMSNWEYGTHVPTMQYRSAMTVPRTLSLFPQGGDYYVSNSPVEELSKIRQHKKDFDWITVSHTRTKELPNNRGAYELILTIKPNKTKDISFSLNNKDGEKVVFTYQFEKGKFSIDRRFSGIVDFSEKFATVTSIAISEETTYTLHIYIDKASIETFDGEGKWSMTNLVFPKSPYTHLSFDAADSSYRVHPIYYTLN